MNLLLRFAAVLIINIIRFIYVIFVHCYFKAPSDTKTKAWMEIVSKVIC